MAQKDKKEPEVHDITDAVPVMEPQTRSRAKKIATVTAIAVAGFFVAEDGVRRFRERKNVKVVVEDKTPPSDA